MCRTRAPISTAPCRRACLEARPPLQRIAEGFEQIASRTLRYGVGANLNCIQNPITVFVFKTRSQYLSPRKGLHGAAGQRSVNYSDAHAQCHDGLCVVLHFVGVFADDDRFLRLLQESAEGIEGVLVHDQRLRLCVFPLLSALLARRARLPVPTGSTH